MQATYSNSENIKADFSQIHKQQEQDHKLIIKSEAKIFKQNAIIDASVAVGAFACAAIVLACGIQNGAPSSAIIINPLIPAIIGTKFIASFCSTIEEYQSILEKRDNTKFAIKRVSFKEAICQMHKNSLQR